VIPLLLMGAALAGPLEDAHARLAEGAVADAADLAFTATVEAPDDPAAWLTLARCLNLLGQPANAQLALVEAQMTGADAALLATERGRALLLQERWDEALETLEGVEGERAALLRAQAKAALGDYAGARTTLPSEAVDPDTAAAAAALGGQLRQVPYLLPEDLDLRLSAGAGFVYNPGYAPRGNFMRAPDGIVGGEATGRYTFLDDADKALALSFGATYGRHFAQTWFQPRGLNLGVEVLGEGWSLHPAYEHFRYDELPLFHELRVPGEIERGDWVLAGIIRGLIQPQSDFQHDDENMTGLYLSGGAARELALGPLELRLGAGADIGLTRGDSRRFVCATLLASARYPLGEQLLFGADYAGATRIYLDGSDVNSSEGDRLLAYGNDLALHADYELFPGQTLRASLDVQGRLSTIGEFYGYAHTTARVDWVLVF
jgi:hypothetical protein